MINIEDIKKSVNQLLRARYKDINIVANYVEDGFSSPAFFTNIIPMGFEHLSRTQLEEKYLVVIDYFPSTKKESELLQKITEIRELLGMKLVVENRKLNIDKLGSKIIDGRLQVQFELNYIQFKEEDNKGYKTLQEVIITNKIS